MKNIDKTEYGQLQQKKMREQMILESMQKSNENGTSYEYTEDQMLQAQAQPAKEEMNEFYNNKIFPTNNGVLYLVYDIFSLIIIPFLYFNEEAYKLGIGVGAWILLIVILIVIKSTDEMYKRDMRKQYKSIECINNFANDTSLFCYMLTSFGYFGGFLCVGLFLFIYIVMLIIFLISLYYKVIKPLWHYKRRYKNS